MSPAVMTSIEGNRQRLDGGAMFGNVPRPLWERWIQPDAMGRIPLACRCLLLEFDGIKVLCETGIGAFLEPKMSERFGVENPVHHQLLENLKAAGHTPESIDYVVLSHLHFDHAGGLLPSHQEMLQGKTDLVFPRARFVVGAEAWQRAEHPHFRDRASFIPGLTEKLEASGRLLLVPNEPLPPPLKDRVEFIISEGHTPGQMHALFNGDRQKVFFCGDLIPGRAWVHLPVTMGYDRFPEKLIDEKAQVYARALKENWLLFFTHDFAVAASQVQTSASGKVEPVYEQLALVRAPL